MSKKKNKHKIDKQKKQHILDLKIQYFNDLL